MEIYIDQYYYFQGAPDRAGQPLQSAVTLQYKMLAKPYSTNSESAKGKCQREERNIVEILNFIPKSQNENSRLNVKIISIKTAGTNAPRSVTESSRSTTDQIPVSQSPSDPGKLFRMRTVLIAFSSPDVVTPRLYNISHSLHYLTRDWGSQPQSGVVAVIMAALVLGSHANVLINRISHAVTRGDNDPAHIRARSAGLNQHAAAAGLSNLIIWLRGGHLDGLLSSADAQDRKSISELIYIVFNHFLYTHSHSKFMHRFTLHLYSHVLFIERV